MFIVKCTNCGREQEWKTGVSVSKAEIRGIQGFCSCGSIVTEENDILREIIANPNEIFD